MNWVERGLVCGIVVPFVIGFSVADAEAPPGKEVCRFQDQQIVESSGLIARDGLFATVNDSGDSGRVFVVDAATCRTVGVTSWSEDAEDIEALAPDGESVLVGDIGDNQASRDSVRLLQVPIGRGDETVTPTTYEITYPDGAQDAEALLVHPKTGQVLIASKGLMAGVLYEATDLSESEPNRMRALADVPGLVTDGAFFPDGRHFVLRTYSRAIFYTYPGLKDVGEMPLPDQQQGEGIAVDDEDRVYVSSEGQHAPVLALDLPRKIRGELRPPPEEIDIVIPPRNQEGAENDVERSVWPWLLGGAFGLAVIGVLLRALRPR